jgi:lysophospholipase L1-like esterase
VIAEIPDAKHAGTARWVGTWACAPQRIEPGDMPPSPGLRGNVLRQVVRPSLGGRQMRVRFSNLFGEGPASLLSVQVARSLGAFAIDPASNRALSFGGKGAVTLQPGATVWSDALDVSLLPLTNLSVTTHFGELPATFTGHPGSRTTSYLQADARFSSDAASTDHWYFLTGIDVLGDSSSAAVVILGDSISDGRGSTTNGNDRWPDHLAARLQANAATAKISALNLGVGGNAVLRGGLGPTALERFERDVIGQSAARWLVVLEGVNDIGASPGSEVAGELIAAYQHIIAVAHDHGREVYGVPILPFAGSAYDSQGREQARRLVNHWIRTSGAFDAVIDLDATVCDPDNPGAVLPDYDSGDGLHLNVAGYRAMAGAIDLELFSR